MKLQIRTPDSRFALCTGPLQGMGLPVAPAPANDAPLDEAVALLHRALTQLACSGSLIAAAYVDQALSTLRMDRLVGEGG